MWRRRCPCRCRSPRRLARPAAKTFGHPAQDIQYLLLSSRRLLLLIEVLASCATAGAQTQNILTAQTANRSIENGGGASEVSGNALAGPIANAVIQAVLRNP